MYSFQEVQCSEGGEVEVEFLHDQQLHPLKVLQTALTDIVTH